MSDAVRFAAMIPAMRAACSGSPFLTAPLRTTRRAPADIAIEPRAIASRAVAGLPPTSTILMRPARSTCVSLPFLLLTAGLSLSQEKREAFERHRQVDALQLHVVGHLQRAGRKIEDGFDAR